MKVKLEQVRAPEFLNNFLLFSASYVLDAFKTPLHIFSIITPSRGTILNSVRQPLLLKVIIRLHVSAIDLVILRPILSIVSQDAMHTLGSCDTIDKIGLRMTNL